MTDFLTVLTCTPGHRCAKLYHDPAQKPEPYNAGFLFAVEPVPVASLAELAEALDGLRAMPDAMVIRDRLRPDAKPAPNGLFARRRVDRPNDPAPFEAAEHSWAMFDADTTASAFDPQDPVGSVEAWRALLPEALRTAAMVFQFSASQHLSANVRGHAWVWLAEPLGGVPLARWSSRNGLDPAVFHAVQPLYTADPLFAEGTADPLAPRWLVVLEGNEAVELDLTEQDHIEGALLSQNGQRLGSIHLAEVGDPSLEPEAVDARARLVKQLEGAFSGPGKRWELCGHIGGACANVGAPPEECCAILEGLRAEDVPDHEFAAGLQWALGAYSFSARPMGLKGISLLCGPVVSIAVGNSLRVLGEIYREPTPEEEAAAKGETLEVSRPEALAVFGAVESFEKMPEPPAYICAGLALAAGKISLCSGYAGTGKGPWIGYVLLCIAAGLPIGPFAVKRTPTALIDFETGPIAITRLQRLANALGLDLRALLAEGWFHFVTGTPPLSDEMIGAARHLARSGVGAIGLDSYTSAVGGDQNSPEFAGPAWLLGAVSNETGALVLANAHEKKKQDNKRGGSNLEMLSGTNTLAAACQTVMSIVRPDDDLKTVVEMRCARAPEEGFDPFQVRWDDVSTVAGKEFLRGGLADSKWGLRPTFIGQRAPTQLEQRANAKAAEKQARLSVLQEDILKLLAGGQCLPADQIRTMLSAGTDRVREAVGALREEGVIVLGSTPAAGGKLVGGWMLAPRSPRSAEALAKHQGAGFLAGGPLKK